MEPDRGPCLPRDARFRILVIDDDQAASRQLGTVLEAEGYDVETCNDDAGALLKAVEWMPHIALLALNGDELCRRLRESRPGMRIVFVTSSTLLRERVSGLDAGADDYVCKPYDLFELLARIRAQLREAGGGVQPGAGLDFRAFGTFRVSWRGGDGTPMTWDRRKPRTLLKLLLTSWDRVVASEVIEEALWPGLSPLNARRSLHVCVQRLRHCLRPFGADRIETGSKSYCFRLQPSDRLDLRDFEEVARNVGGALEVYPARGARLDDIDRLMAIYEDDLFTDEPSADWVIPIRERFRATFLKLMGSAASAYRHADEMDKARAILHRILDLVPHDEARALELAACRGDAADAADAHGISPALAVMKGRLQGR